VHIPHSGVGVGRPPRQQLAAWRLARLARLGIPRPLADVVDVDAVIIDANFDPALDTSQRWAEVPRTLAPLLAAAA